MIEVRIERQRARVRRGRGGVVLLFLGHQAALVRETRVSRRGPCTRGVRGFRLGVAPLCSENVAEQKQPFGMPRSERQRVLRVALGLRHFPQRELDRTEIEPCTDVVRQRTRRLFVRIACPGEIARRTPRVAEAVENGGVRRRQRLSVFERSERCRRCAAREQHAAEIAQHFDRSRRQLACTLQCRTRFAESAELEQGDAMQACDLGIARKALAAA